MEELVWEAKGLRAEAPSPCVFSKMKRTNPGNSESGELGGMGIGFGPWSSKKWGGFFFFELRNGEDFVAKFPEVLWYGTGWSGFNGLEQVLWKARGRRGACVADERE